MAERVHKGYAARCLEGKERSDDGIFSKAPEGRFKLFWDILKGRFGRLVLVNLILVLFFAPLMAVIVLRAMSVSGQISAGPYAGGLGIGVGAAPDVTGVAESMLLYTDLIFFAILIPALIIAGIGLSGGAYLIRNLVRTEGVFEIKDFFRGIKRNVFVVFEAVFLFAIVLFVARYMGNYADYAVATHSPISGWMIASKVIGYIFVGLVSLVSLWMIALGVSYKQGPWALFKNAVVLTFTTFPQTVLFAVLSVWPFFVIIFVSDIFFTITIAAMVFIGFCYALLVWMNYTQWAFDRYISPDLVVHTAEPEAKEGDKPKAKTAEEQQPDPEAVMRVVVAYGKSDLASRPIQPLDEDESELYTLPESFSRADLAKLKESRESLSKETEAYVAAHKNEAKYIEYNKQFEERDRALQGKGKGKKLSPPKPAKRRK